MYGRILIAMLLFLALAGAVAAEDTEQASDKLAGKDVIYLVIFSGSISAKDLQDGKGFTTTLDLRVVPDEGHTGKTLDKAVKYRVSWTSGGKWLSYKKPNPDHLRRGNLFFDADEHGELFSSFKVAAPAGVLSEDKTFRLRVRAIYADKTRDVCTMPGEIDHLDSIPTHLSSILETCE